MVSRVGAAPVDEGADVIDGVAVPAVFSARSVWLGRTQRDSKGGAGRWVPLDRTLSQGVVMMLPMEFASTVEFARVARRLGRAAVRAGWVAPSFRCPPRLVGVDRTILRRRDSAGGGAVVSVRVRGRPQEAVVADMIEGIVVANRLVSPAADRLRTDLWSAVAADLAPDTTDVRTGRTRVA